VETTWIEPENLFVTDKRARISLTW
jgi:hypothetical protein